MIIRLYQITDNHITVEVEPKRTAFNEYANDRLYVDFELNDNSTVARWKFLDGHYGGKITEWGRKLTEDECLDYCEKHFRNMM